ncbi:unnamed protein product [Ranitomeya imitator]|uniref:DUF4795 domain-containing protein n=1 Tax=Ranitomeya imitator TaxID=111125 RepID=A0ABN9MHB6_9NEOB|nr:unnamed protein product [Ranitomeya imitator]
MTEYDDKEHIKQSSRPRKDAVAQIQHWNIDKEQGRQTQVELNSKAANELTKTPEEGSPETAIPLVTTEVNSATEFTTLLLCKNLIPEDLLQQLRSVRQDVDALFAENRKDKVDFSALKNGLHDLNMALQRLDSKTDKLANDLSETAKADRRALETLVGHADLEAAVSEVNAVLEALIKKLAVQESEWQNMLAKLLAGLEAKLSRSDLDSVHKDLEELWKFLKKHLSSSQTFDPDGVAGFRKKLFERVKCISCDRPVTIATAPHLVTVRSLNPRSRDYKTPGNPLQMSDPELQYSESPRPHSACSIHRKSSRNQNPQHGVPVRRPGQIQYKNTEYDLMGIDGVMYKGRLDKSHTAYTAERDAPDPTAAIQDSSGESALCYPTLQELQQPHLMACESFRAIARTALPTSSATDSAQPMFYVPSTMDGTNMLQQPNNAEEQAV